jgi:hypothetical protein
MIRGWPVELRAGSGPMSAGRIISLKDYRRARPVGREEPAAGCAHRRVVVERAERRVRCEVCGAELDAFEVLVSLVQRLASEDENARPE